MNEDEVVQRLKIARRELDSLYPAVQMIDGWKYDNANKLWYYHISISVETENRYFPITSQWYVVVEPTYPQGKVKIFPDIDNSITTTLYHQANNYFISKNGLWRSGSLCVDVNTLSSHNPEPFSVEDRLLFHVQRAVEWLESAANNRLVSSNELFELPEFNDNILLDCQFAFSEDIVTYMQWEDVDYRYGLVDIDCYKSKPTIFYPKTFYSFENKPIHHLHWGIALEKQNSDRISKSPWLLLKSVPVLKNWQVPETWEELQKVCESQGYDIKAILKKSSRYLRDGLPHLFLVGFPIPIYWFQENEIIYWKAFLLPTLSCGHQVPKGFRKNEKGYWHRDVTVILKNYRQIDWILSENWSQEEISQRGKMSKTIQRKRILLIGAGCIGASISEILVRAGIYSLSIADSDIFKVGNLSRHTLNLNSIGSNKCTSLCSHLNTITPHAEIKPITNQLLLTSDSAVPHTNIDIECFDIIIDCTGEDSVLNTLSSIELKHPHYLISVSVGFGARKLYINMQNNTRYNFDNFYEFILPYTKDDLRDINESTLPRDGIGCWHPTFPARSDDIWMAAAVSVKNIEKYINTGQSKQISLVYEQKENDYYESYSLIDKCECD